jgi:D-hydroxyproline dehydrogenase subunit beta
VSRGADVIVIGAGIVGAACAHALAQRGQRVLVVDAGLPAATAAGMGHLIVLDDNPAELAISHYSLQRWRDWSRDLPEDCAHRQNGTLWLAATAEEMALAEAKYQALRTQGLDCQLLGASALQAAEPALRKGLHGALKVASDGIVYAPNVARWLLNQPLIERRQGQVVEIDGNRVRLQDGTWLSAQALILANGIHARNLCPELPLQAKKGHLLITDRYPTQVSHCLVELGYVSSAHNATGPSVAANIQPRPTGQLLIGASRQFDSESAEVEPGMLARMLRRAVDYMPGLAGLNAIRTWTGLRAACPDGLPLLGEHPQRPGLWLAVGHEGLGVTCAPGSADLLVAQLFGERAPLAPDAYLPKRFLGDAAHA